MFRCALCLNVFNVCLHVFFSDFVNSRSRPVDRIKVSFMVEVRTRAASRYRSWSKFGRAPHQGILHREIQTPPVGRYFLIVKSDAARRKVR
ncbi:hypothetical protein GCK32_015824 [Trichostrongylus colubriformis]|uniref:Secreted protein n=1 Tax=Trichostrongylus colubriformis TaxID=6319 RepID=A0AAN8FCG6_TRICO